ncbi:uroporphyrinogen decarboxylase family protein [Candidatus Lokiarchaeum ossiferum]|uniref:uroporphyrinogen decarboxylase family protein n=1 Tax=Candidatus Lokiarchaeum ossiferum TaxID=2951803 RepID=UPI00352CBB52
MKKDTLNSMERILNTLSHKKVDRIPFILTLTHHGAKELNLSIKDYYANPVNVIKGQKILQNKYQHDAVMGANYFAFEIEAFGGDVIYFADGPPNTGLPPLADKELINSLEIPSFEHIESYQNTLQVIKGLKSEYSDTMPIIGGVLSPFSIPITQMGFDKYIELLYNSPDEFQTLMHINIEYCKKWANAQLAAGATFIVYFDPMSSTDMIPREMYLKLGYPVAKKTFAGLNGPFAIHFASGRTSNTFGDVSSLNPSAVGVSAHDNIQALLQKYPNGPSILGNLSGINMVHWSKEDTMNHVKSLINSVKSYGRTILADNHGEIPYAVPNVVLKGISEAIDLYGRYD